MRLFPTTTARLNHRPVQSRIKALPRSNAVIPIVFGATLGLTLLFQIQLLRTALSGVDHTHQVISSEQELLKLNVDMETGLRGFQYTGNPEFLQPYTEAAKIVDSKFAALDRLSPKTPPSELRLQTSAEASSSGRRRQRARLRGGQKTRSRFQMRIAPIKR